MNAVRAAGAGLAAGMTIAACGGASTGTTASRSEVNPQGPYIQVENLHGAPVEVTPWDGGSVMTVADRALVTLPRVGNPAPPLHVRVTDPASRAVLYDGRLGYGAPQIVLVHASSSDVRDSYELAPDDGGAVP